MKRLCVLAMNVGLAGALIATSGCHDDETGRRRPPVDELSDGGRGLQGKDVVTASDEMAQSLLSSPSLNASRTQWTVVVDHVDNLSQSQRGNLDIFLIRLRGKLSQLGNGRITLIENRDKLNQLQSQELDATPDRFGQGGGAAVPARIQPDYYLSAKLADLPNGETDYFLVDFTLTGNDRRIVWEGMYEVSTGR